MSYNDEEKAVKNFIIVFLIVILMAVGLYFFTAKVVKKDEATSTNETETKEVNIDNSVAIVGNMLSKAEDHYYVVLYKSDSDDAGEYMTLMSKYEALDKHLALYTVDLSNQLNSKYVDEENTNTTASDLNDLRFGKITLLEVKNSKIVKSYESLDKIKKVLKVS